MFIFSFVMHYVVSFLVLQSPLLRKRELVAFNIILSHDVESGSEITPCNKIDKPLVVYRFTGNVMTSITMTKL